MTTQPRTHIDIGTSKLGYRTTGAGPDAVFIHGWPLNKETWRNITAALPNITCHLIDLPGSGTSITATDVPVSLPLAVDAVAAAIEELGLETFALIGQDSGGLIARFVADRFPDRVTHLIMSGTEIPHHHPKQIERLQAAARLPGAAAVTRWMMTTPRVSRSKQVLGACFSDRSTIEGSFRSQVIDPTFTDPRLVRRQLEMLASYSTDWVDSVLPVHGRITCPTLLIWGNNDSYFPARHAREMATQFAGPTRFELVDDASLFVHEEQPTRFAELMAAFIAEHPAIPADAS